MLLIITACTDYAAQRRADEAGRLVDESIAFQHDHDTHCRQPLSDPRFGQIAARIATYDPPTLIQLSDAQRPTLADRALILEWATLLGNCRNRGFPPPIGFPWDQFQIAIASLIAGEVTYASYNRRIIDLVMAAKAQSETIATQQAAHAAIAQAQADVAAAALADALSAEITAAIFSSGRHR